MTTLDEAWNWHQVTRRLLRLTGRLGEKYWDALPWDGPLGRDQELRDVGAGELSAWAQHALTPLDDVAVVVLFSVFEATVRQQVLAAVGPEVSALRHPALRHAAKEACQAVEEGSFFRVLEPFKGEGLADLVEEVNQVRKYRNWVAHGRRGQRPAKVEPDAAYDRLRRFLDVLQPPTAPPRES